MAVRIFKPHGLATRITARVFEVGPILSAVPPVTSGEPYQLADPGNASECLSLLW